MSSFGVPGDAAATEAPPFCYRHPGRESYIHCQRCGRTICPECQTPAAVGVHCPECVREANRTRPAARTAFGGVVPSGDGALVTKALIGLCVVTFVLTEYIRPSLWPDLAMVGYAQERGGSLVGIADGQYWRLLTPVLVHGGIAHVAINMFSLWMLGPFLEQALGRARFLTLFVVGAIGGSTMSFVFSAPTIPSVGASGAIFALVGALIPIYRRLKLNPSSVFLTIAINAAIGFTLPNIDWRAHLGGLITGTLLGFAFAYAPRERRTVLHVAAVVAVLAVVVVVVALRTAALTG